MSLKEKITTGIINKPFFIAVYGQAGIGKSSFGAAFPEPIFLPTEEGTNQLNVARFPKPTSFTEVIEMLNELPLTYKTLVIDSLDSLETLIWRACVAEANDFKIKTIEDFGYGKGYVVAGDKWKQFFDKLNILRDSMNIVLICHSQFKTVNDPFHAQPFDRNDLKLNKSASSLIKESVDAILFATFEVHVKTDKSGKSKAFGDGKRILYTEGRPWFEAKNRYGLPHSIPFSYESFIDAYKKADPSNLDGLIQSINAKILSLASSEHKKAAEKFLLEAGKDLKKLTSANNRLDILLN